jgi:hypothetical protein
MKQLLKKFIRQSITDVGTQNDADRELWVKSVFAGLPKVHAYLMPVQVRSGIMERVLRVQEAA